MEKEYAASGGSDPSSWVRDWQPYTILGDDHWQDYEVSADVYLNPGDSAGVMGRIIDVGPGYRSVRKGYFLQLSDDGRCRLVVVRGKKDTDRNWRALLSPGSLMRNR